MKLYKLPPFLFILIALSCKTTTQMIAANNVYGTSQFGFSQAITANGLLFTSGQVGWNKNYELTGTGSFKEQVEQSFINVKNVIEHGNSSINNVILIRLYVKDLNEEKRNIIGKQLSRYYPTAYKPATTLIGIQALARADLLIEIEAIAKTN